MSNNPAENHRHVMAEVERWTKLTPGEYLLYIDQFATKQGVDKTILEKMYRERMKELERQKLEAQKDEQRRDERKEKEEERKHRKQRERAKAFAEIAELPAAQHEARLTLLATQLGEDLDTLRDEFSVFLDILHKDDVSKGGKYKGDVEPWPDPVDSKKLLTELQAQLRRYNAHRDEVMLAIVLWTMMAWVHNEIAVHSPLLVLTSAEPDSGKTTTIGVLEWLTPRAYPTAEITGPALFRFVDQVRPTLMIDDADNLLKRRNDLVHIINAGWTRGTPVPRRLGTDTVFFNPFCPKVIGLIGMDLPKATVTRSIICKLVPKLPEERVEKFRYRDDDTFQELRRKLTRWSTDNMAALEDAHPVMSPEFINRFGDNWELLLAIADLAGISYGEQARAAAVKLDAGRKRADPSTGKRALAALQQLIWERYLMIPSDEIVKLLAADKESEWYDYHGHPITVRELSLLLDPYDIHPGVIHPKGQPVVATGYKGKVQRAEWFEKKSARGYKAEWFTEVFRRHLRTTVHPPAKRTTVHPPAKRKKKKRDRARKT